MNDEIDYDATAKAYDMLCKRLNKLFKMTWLMMSYEFSCFKTAGSGKVIAEFIESKTSRRIILDIFCLTGNNMLHCPLVIPYFYNRRLEPAHAMCVFQDKIYKGCSMIIVVNMSDPGKYVFFDKNDTLESLAVEHDLSA